MARSAIAWSSGTRTLLYSGRTAPVADTQRKTDGFSHELSVHSLCLLLSPFVFRSTYWNPRWTAPLFPQRQCSPRSPMKHERMNESPFNSFLPLSSPPFSVTYSVHPLPVERHHRMGRVAHEDTFVANVIWGALDRHHGLPRQSEIIPLESITARHKWR